ncbi:MFS transporter [Radiobacillus kanasensis]|uniref:MFS transporter n=1 Tax=Radiobacillus kanasensis TaxID=2844358 RepID=UPI001E3FD82D|nr:MFS transporter [Radiobacillus kanasensis]UFT98352.1 MFS transporter [Radiobacillus kanasensis]
MKQSILLLSGIGISSLGDFIYLVAINILVLNLTGSPAAVAGLWIISPIAALLTKVWSGSLIDRVNNRRLMIILDISRALLVFILPFLTSIWFIYLILFGLSICKAFFEPASMKYITSLIPKGDRKRFNSFRSMLTSGAFLVGPAISGVLLLLSSVHVAIWINAASFLVSAYFLYLLPNVDSAPTNSSTVQLGLNILKRDWLDVLDFSKNHLFVITIYSLFQLFMVVALGMDTQEVVFTQKVLHLSETDFGLLISITGIGSILGATTVSLFAHKLSIRSLMWLGFAFVAIGYLIYAFSFSFWSVAFGFIILGFFNSFSSTGFMTFYQNNIPVSIMGRVSSIFGMFQSVSQIFFILLIGFTGEVIPLRYSIIGASILILAISIMAILLLFKNKYQEFLEEERDITKIN